MSGPLVIALDPGYERSAVVVTDGLTVFDAGILANDVLLAELMASTWCCAGNLVIEQIESFGMPVGREIFETVFWSGRFVEAWPGPWARVARRQVKAHLCHSARATDAHVRQALIDRFGPGKAAAIGVKAKPGPLYGLKADLWQALGLAVTWLDLQQDGSWMVAPAARSRSAIVSSVSGDHTSPSSSATRSATNARSRS